MNQVYSCIGLVMCVSFVVAKLDDSVLTGDHHKLMETLHEMCFNKTGASEADIEKLKVGEFVENKEIKCYSHCVLAETGSMDEDGEIDLRALVEVVPDNIKESVKSDFEACAKLEDEIEDHCEKAYAIIKCVHERDPDTFYFI